MYNDLSSVIGVSYDILENGYYNTNFADVLLLVDPLFDKEPKVGFAVGDVHFKSLISGLRYDIQVNESQKMKTNFVRLNELIPIRNTHYYDVDIKKMSKDELISMANDVLKRPVNDAKNNMGKSK